MTASKAMPTETRKPAGKKTTARNPSRKNTVSSPSSGLRPFLSRLRAVAVIGAVLSLAGCETSRPMTAPPGSTTGDTSTSSTAAPVPPGQLILQPASFEALPGWGQDRLSDALPALLKSCAAIAKQPRDRALGPAGIAGTPADWEAPCQAARRLPARDDTAIAAYFQQAFRPFKALDSNEKPGLFTAYFEPELLGSRVRTKRFKVPLYRAPATPVSYSRAEIDAGILAGRKLELLWVEDPVDAFFLQVQGSGRIRLPDGTIQRVGYAGDNGQTFGPIGRMMIDAGLIDRTTASMQTIRAWLKTHPDEATGWMQKNPRYVFFREIQGEGPVGAQALPLTPGRSLAVDPAYLALGLPLWLDTTWPVDLGANKKGDPFRRLMVAQDVGAAIKGPVRGDIFWGSGEPALVFAGSMKNQGSYYVFLPAGVASRRLALVSDLNP